MTPQEYVLYVMLAVCIVLIMSYPLFSIIFAAYFNQKLNYMRQLMRTKHVYKEE